MNRNTNFFLVLTPLLLFSISCQKDKFSCVITHPKNGQEFFEDENITVSIEANENGDNTALLYIDNECYTGTTEVPYDIIIKAGDIDTGMRTIKTVMQNNKGKQCEAFVCVFIKSVKHESPDSVTFLDGKLPIGWETLGWYINPTPLWSYSYPEEWNDQFSLATRTNNAVVTVHKTFCNIKFYMRGAGYVFLYVDGVILDKIYMNADGDFGIPQDWTKYEYSFSKNCSTFTWKFMPFDINVSFAGLDEISFK